MRSMVTPKTGAQRRFKRHLRVRNKVSGTAERPRLVVFRSLKHIYAQLVDDVANRTIATVSDQKIEQGKKGERAVAVGKLIAERAKTAGISRVVFDRAGYRYHGRVKAVADGAREGGLEF
jgi:large subunit ribosomal protein L18